MQCGLPQRRPDHCLLGIGRVQREHGVSPALQQGAERMVGIVPAKFSRLIVLHFAVRNVTSSRALSALSLLSGGSGSAAGSVHMLEQSCQYPVLPVQARFTECSRHETSGSTASRLATSVGVSCHAAKAHSATMGQPSKVQEQCCEGSSAGNATKTSCALPSLPRIRISTAALWRSCSSQVVMRMPWVPVYTKNTTFQQRRTVTCMC